MKHVAAILLSLLLIAAQTFAVAAPVSGGSAAEAKSSCCDGCVNCACCVTESEGGPVSAPPATLPVRGGGQFTLLPSAPVLFGLTSACADRIFPFLDASLTAVQPPLFQRNCVLLI